MPRKIYKTKLSFAKNVIGNYFRHLAIAELASSKIKYMKHSKLVGSAITLKNK